VSRKPDGSQVTDLQLDALAAGVTLNRLRGPRFGGKDDQICIGRVCQALRAGDTLVVWKR